MAGPNGAVCRPRRRRGLTVAPPPDPDAIQGREADEAGQVTHRSLGLRANLERFSDVETNWLRDLGRPRCPPCARTDRRRTSLCADGTGRTRCRTVECRPAADSGCTGNDRRHSSSPRAAGNGCFASQSYEDDTGIRLGIDAARQSLHFILATPPGNRWRKKPRSHPQPSEACPTRNRRPDPWA